MPREGNHMMDKALGKRVLIVGGKVHRQVPREYRGIVRHIPQKTRRVRVPENVQYIVEIVRFVSHIIVQQVRSQVRGKRVKWIRVVGSESQVKAVLRNIECANRVT